ncbi:MAG TPA: hypothetical protein VL523_18750 [Terriglobia bacterium]|nr:hypothetical protein [Terriglobia bacterium]
MPDDGKVTAPQDNRKRCVACRELIQPDARLCPLCRSSQVREHWKLVGTGLKWVGGTAAVISLLIGMNQVDSLFQSWRSRQETVAELAKAAAMQTDAGDYAGAWKLYEQARQLEPGSPAARQGQVQLAMVWLRNIHATGNQSFSDIVDELLPVLYRAAASAKPQEAADALAHIGWANYLKNRDLGISDAELWGPQVDEEFDKALKLDSGNVYAHAMRGFWILYRHGRLADANQQFASALESGRERQYVQQLRLWALLNGENSESDLEEIRVADEMRRNHDSAQPEQRRRIAENAYTMIRSGELSDRLVSEIPADDQLKTLAWLVEGTDLDAHSPLFHLYHARLTEAAGDRPAALAEYRALQAEHDVASDLSEEAASGIDRITQGEKQKAN